MTDSLNLHGQRASRLHDFDGVLDGDDIEWNVVGRDDLISDDQSLAVGVRGGFHDGHVDADALLTASSDAET